MKLFKSTKNEVYKMLGEGIADWISSDAELVRDGYLSDINRNERPFKTYYEILQECIHNDIKEIEDFRKDVPIILEYVGDGLLKRGHVEQAYRFYNKVNSKKASILEKLFSEEKFKEISDSKDEYSIDKKLEEIMDKYNRTKRMNEYQVFDPTQITIGINR